MPSLQKKIMKRSLLFASMAIAAGITLVNVYTSLVDVPSWSSNVPHSIETARKYFAVSNPGTFFRIFSPLNQALGLICLLAFWKRSVKVRLLLGSAFLLYFIAEGMTFMYFYPRNAILLGAEPIDINTMQTVLNEWSSMNWVRTFVVASGFVCSATALHYTYQTLVSGKPVVRAGKRKADLADVQFVR